MCLVKKKIEWFDAEILSALQSGDSAKKICIDLCDTNVMCISISAELTPDRSLAGHAVLHSTAAVSAFGLLKPCLAW